MMKRIDVIDDIKNARLKNPNLQQIVTDLVKKSVGGNGSKDMESKVRLFLLTFKQKYSKNNRTWDRLLKNEAKWLQGTLYCHSHSQVGTGRP